MISCIHLLSYIVNLIIQQINNMTDRELNQNQETDRLKVKSIENNTAKNRIHRSSISLELRAETKNEILENVHKSLSNIPCESNPRNLYLKY